LACFGSDTIEDNVRDNQLKVIKCNHYDYQLTDLSRLPPDDAGIERV